MLSYSYNSFSISYGDHFLISYVDQVLFNTDIFCFPFVLQSFFVFIPGINFLISYEHHFFDFVRGTIFGFCMGINFWIFVRTSFLRISYGHQFFDIVRGSIFGFCTGIIFLKFRTGINFCSRAERIFFFFLLSSEDQVKRFFKLKSSAFKFLHDICNLECLFDSNI